MLAWLRTRLSALLPDPRALRADTSKLRLDPRRLRLGGLLALINVAMVIVVVAVIAASAAGLLRDLATENALATVQLRGALAREEVRRVGEDTLTSARLLAERPTLIRLIDERRVGAIVPFLARYCETGHSDGCAVVHDGQVVAQAGAAIPWAEVTAPFIGTVTKSGTDGDGVLTLIGALVIAGLGFLAFGSRRSRGAIIGSLVVAGLIALVAVVDMVDVSSRIADVEDQDLAVSASIGIGLWVVLLGAGVAIVGCVLRLTGPKGRAGV